MAPHLSSWSDLPKELLEKIADRLDSRIHRLRIRAVCSSWFFGLTRLCQRTPLKLPFPIQKPKRRGHFELVRSTICCLQPLKNPTDTSMIATRCWLIMIEDTQEFGKLRLKDPLTHPAYSEILSPRLPKTLNLLDYRVSEIKKVYDLEFVGDRNIITEMDHDESLSASAEKIAVCSEGPRFAVMAIHGAGLLSIWKEGDPEWRSVVDPQRFRSCFDVVYHNGKFYVQDASAVTISVDLSSESTALVRPVMHPSEEGSLLSHGGDLFLVQQPLEEADMIFHFQVHRLNEDEGEWVLVNSLGSRAIFVGDGSSFGVSPEECGGGCNMNCIYYIDYMHQFGDDIGKIRPFKYAALFDVEHSTTKFLSRVLGSFGLFWPPPSWVMAWRIVVGASVFV